MCSPIITPCVNGPAICIISEFVGDSSCSCRIRTSSYLNNRILNAVNRSFLSVCAVIDAESIEIVCWVGIQADILIIPARQQVFF